MKIKKYNLNSKDIWNNFNKDAKNGLFMFDRNYMDYHSDRFMDNSLMFYEDEKLIALLPCNVVENILYSHQGLTFGGFIVDENMKQGKMLECFEVLKEYMKENNFKKLIYKSIPYIYHKIPAQEDLYALFRNNAKLFRRDIASVVDYGNMVRINSKKRNKINKLKKSGIDIVYSDKFRDFINLENEILSKYHNTKAVHTSDEMEYLKLSFSNNIHLYEARQSSQILAGVVVYEYDNVIHTQYMANSDEGRKIGALDLLIYFLINEKYTDRKYFDFGISTENGGQFLNHGLISQKEEFGGRGVIYDFYELCI
ncbi:GNAT family N-acetyltransferase [Campylobacter coli]|nr:GNAT family N-acetyltransferase [Campylobacter coli]EAL5796404.1 GNAT family N-acetyltransferase [Campylobacter coli]EDO7366126.1 GNAT family N-acetyltransferase [Campylobacter coli]EFP0139628.1 GNAT family N-acetyltransferase [Campylobacter coli]EGX8335073.1 GNAT family N-acetyltransferase [Campylobacter coli]